MGACDKSVKYMKRVIPCVSNARVENFNSIQINRDNFSGGTLKIFNGLKYGKHVKT